jgi:acetyl esterase/lipase
MTSGRAARALPIAMLTALGLACVSSPGAHDYSVERDLAYGDAPLQVGDLYRPAGAGPHPAVLLIHGGAWVRGDRANMRKFAERFAAAGFVAWNLEYRLAPDATWPAQLDDVRAALAWLRARAREIDVDPERIAAMGYSAGGHLALLLALAEGDGPRLAVVASGAGPTDLLAYPHSPLIAKLMGGDADALPDAWEDASPISHVSPGDPPVFLYHGALDRVVGIEQSRRLLARLREAGVPSELYEEPWSGHSTAYLLDRDAFARVLGFFEARLRPGSAPPS